jgi:hypothetical protein
MYAAARVAAAGDTIMYRGDGHGLAERIWALSQTRI